jgi:hypothetical protein
MRTKKTCCCCGDRTCRGDEYRYNSTENTNCKICALGVTTVNVSEYEDFAPSEPSANQGDEVWLGMDGDGHPDNLYMGNICWHNGHEGWDYYPNECEWNKCWNDYESFGLSNPPKVSFYQFDSPYGILPWSPISFMDWRDNWNGPLLPQGDCTMHCTQENIGCHSLAFVGAIGKNFGSTDLADGLPLCGSDIVTVPPPRSEWDWIRSWVKSGGKLIIMGESSGSPMSSMPSCRTKMDFFNPDSSYYTQRCTDAINSEDTMSGEEVALLLQEFAFYIARQDDEEEESIRWFEFENEEVEPDNFINNFEAYVDDDGNETAIVRSCCQKSKRPFIKRDSVDDPMKPFSFQCSSSSGLLPKGKGKGLVGHCNGDGCTVVWKPNDLGAVVVVYDSDVWGASNSQIPLSWWEQEAQYPQHQELGLGAIELKTRACNNDFWNFMCVDFLSENAYIPSECGDEVYWKHKESDDYEFGENPCLKTAKCCIPDGSCIETNIWDCWGYTDYNGRELPGTWYGSEFIHPDGRGGGECQSCGSCEEFKKGLCCVVDPDGLGCGHDCCLELDNVGHEMYEYECNCLVKSDNYSWVNEVEWKQGETNCDICFVKGACCTGNEMCEVMREIECNKLYGPEFFHGEDSTCDPENPCEIPRGACCDGFTCISDVTEDFCNSSGGEYMGDEMPCDEDLCEGDPGACCLPNGNCVFDTEHDCNSLGGTWQGANVQCNQVDCDISQACCIPTGVVDCYECNDMMPDACYGASGEPQGNGIMCDDDPCDESGCGTGACCYWTGSQCSCFEAEEEDCDCYPGWDDCFKPGKNCGEVDCCGICCDRSNGDCLSGGACTIPEWVCNSYDNELFIPCTDCGCISSCSGEYTSCEGVGICCVEEECEDVTSSQECIKLNGIYTIGTQCADVSSSFCRLGACCVEEECVEITIKSACDGTWVEGILDCGEVDCGIGACCYYQNVIQPHECEDMLLQVCIDKFDGEFHSGTLCEDDADLCIPTGACCFENGGDMQCACCMTEDDCEYVYNGVWIGGVDSCDDIDCDNIGPCCIQPPNFPMDCSYLRFSECEMMNEDACLKVDGFPGPNGTDCAGYSCAGTCCAEIEYLDDGWMTLYWCDESVSEHFCDSIVLADCFIDQGYNVWYATANYSMLEDCCWCQESGGTTAPWEGPCCFGTDCDDNYTECECNATPDGVWMGIVDNLGCNNTELCGVSACCIQSNMNGNPVAGCVMMDADECTDFNGQSGTVFGDNLVAYPYLGVHCDDNPCLVGCCVKWWDTYMGCNPSTIGDCDYDDGDYYTNPIEWFWDGQWWNNYFRCAYDGDNNELLCPQACCEGTNCTNTIYSDCWGDVVWGEDCDWDGDPCIDTGACCTPNSGCSSKTQAECVSNHNPPYYPTHWISEDCGDVECDDYFGACCDWWNVECYETTEDECPGDAEFELGIKCHQTQEVCMQVHACCWSDGSCDDEIWFDCWDNWGNWDADHLCSDWGFNCAETGACCYDDGVCVDSSTESNCIYWGGTWWGEGSFCWEWECAIANGACCYGGWDDCTEDTSQSACNAGGGSFMGAESACIDCVSACCYQHPIYGPYCAEVAAWDCWANYWNGEPHPYSGCNGVGYCWDYTGCCLGNCEWSYCWYTDNTDWHWHDETIRWIDCDGEWYMHDSCGWDCDWCYLTNPEGREDEPSRTRSRTQKPDGGIGGLGGATNNESSNKRNDSRLIPPSEPECSQKCKDAGCDCHCLETNNGIVCL